MCAVRAIYALKIEAPPAEFSRRPPISIPDVAIHFQLRGSSPGTGAP